MLNQFSLEMARLDPACEVVSLGETSRLGPVFGFAEGLRAGLRMRGVLARAEESVVRLAPDAVVLVSFSGLHLPLGRRLRDRGVPVLYLGPPQVWAWGGWRKRRLRKTADEVVCLFRFEEGVLRPAGVNAVYLGYPLLDCVVSKLSREQTLEMLGFGPNEHYVAFLPGSRPAEVSYHAPLFIDVFNLLRQTVPDVRGVIVRSEEGTSQELEARSQQPGGRIQEAAGAGREATGDALLVVSRDRYDVMRHADCACAVSGTVTAELAILGVPMVVCYHLPWPSRVLARALVRIPYFALPNILAGTRLVPEKLDPGPEELARMLGLLLRSPEERRRQLEGLARVAAELGPPGAMARICRLARGLAAAGRGRVAGHD